MKRELWKALSSTMRTMGATQSFSFDLFVLGRLFLLAILRDETRVLAGAIINDADHGSYSISSFV